MTKHNLALAVFAEPDSRVLVQRVVKACEDVKGRDISVRDVRGLSDVSDYVVFASGKSDRQVQGITNRILDTLAQSGISPLSVEGYEDAQWVLIDTGDIVIHVFYEPMRAHYNLESLWLKARPVKVQQESAVLA